MRDQPTGNDLLASARRVLREQILPALTGDGRYAMLMVLNAMSIAERQLRYGEDPEKEEMRALEGLLDESFTDLSNANRRLSMEIREGYGDPGSRDRQAILDHLKGVGRQRLRESNPKILAGS